MISIPAKFGRSSKSQGDVSLFGFVGIGYLLRKIDSNKGWSLEITITFKF